MLSLVLTSLLNGYGLTPVGNAEHIREALEQPAQQSVILHAQSNKTTAPAFEIALPLLLDQKYLGDVSVRVAGDNLSFEVGRFIELLQSELTDSILTSLQSNSEEGRLYVDRVTAEGIDVVYNSELQQIEVNAQINARDVRVFSLRSDIRKFDETPLEPADYSFFATPSINTQYSWSKNGLSGKGLRPIRGTLDIGGRVGQEKGIAFSSRQSFEEGRSFNRTQSQLIYDSFDHGIRVVAGDLNPRGIGFQGLPNIAGISFGRFFDFDPYQIIRPVGNSQFQIDQSSTVEVRVNGTTQRQLALDPGRYDLRDLPLNQGTNITEIIIRDDTGREQIISDRSFFDFNLLEKGLSDFSVSAGVKTQFGNSGVSYSDEPVFTAFARHGLLSDLTVSGDIQADAYGGNIGAGILKPTALGIWQLDGATSYRKNIGTGFAASLAYQKASGLGNDWRLSANASARFFSKDFTNVAQNLLISSLDSDLTTGRNERTLQPRKAIANAGLRVSKDRLTVSSTVNYTKSRGLAPDRFTGLVGANYMLSRDINAGLFTSYSKAGEREETGINFQISWRPDRNKSFRARHDTRRKSSELTFQKSAPNTVGSLTYNLGVGHDGLEDRFNVFGGAYYVGNRFEANLRHDVLSNGLSDVDTVQNSRLSLTSSLVFADGKIGVGRSVRNNFAIFSAHDTLKDKRILVDPRQTGFVSSSDFLGPAVTGNLVPFFNRTTYVDIDNLPIGYDLGTGGFTLRPYQFSGYQLTVGSGKSYTVVGKVEDKKTGAFIPYLGGRLKSLDDSGAPVIPAFTNRKGRLAASGLKTGRYQLTLFTEPEFTREVVIVEDSPNLFDIGVIEVDVE